MKKILLITFVLLTNILVFSQIENHNWCGFDAKLNEAYQQNPNLENEIYEHIYRIQTGQISIEERSEPIVIPVVVHVIHDNGVGDISYAQIEDAIRILNEDFNKLNADTVDTRNTAEAPFKPVAANPGIVFKLAKIDPQGNCTNGVQRKNSPIVSQNADDGNAKYTSGGGLSAWNRNNYFNIWVVNNIATDGGGVTLGYAQFPNWGSAATYGVVIRHDRMGAIGTGNGDRTLTHEVGHCLGLFHIFQSGCGSGTSNCNSQGDGCCDTPPTEEAMWSCVTTQNTCSQVPPADFYGFDAYDQFENYMSYSPCQNMFSADQKNIMLGNIGSIGHLISLTSATNITNTGVDLPGVLCKAEFSYNTKNICAGSTIDFTDNSYFNVSSRTWTFEGGSPASSSDSLVAVTYNTPGLYSVSIQVSDGVGSQSKTETNLIRVLPNPGEGLPYSEGFEVMPFPDDVRFTIDNPDGGQTWQLNSTIGSTSNKSIMINNFGVNTGDKDAFISGPIDLSSLNSTDELIISFDYAYKKRSSTDSEKIKVYVSNDCGLTWSLRRTIQGNALGSEIQSTAYTPVDGDWKSTEITNVNSTFFVSNFRYKIEFENDNGNNIFIDNINIYPDYMQSIDEVNSSKTISVYPNPTSQNTIINYNSSVEEEVIIVLYNSLGQKVIDVYQGNIQQGENTIEISSENLPKGVYYLNINSNTGMETIKIIKN